MVNKRFMSKAMALAICGIIFSSPILASTNAMETSNVEGVIKTTTETNREENQSIIIERGEVLTEDDFCEIYNIYETNLAKGIELTDNEILTLLVKKINDKDSSSGEPFTNESFFYVCRQVGLTSEDMEEMTIGDCLDYVQEYIDNQKKDEKTTARKATQEDFDNF